MDKLLSDLEQATEGSRELDKRVADEVGTVRWIMSKGEPDVGIFGDQELWWPHYTTSLDAALMLVPEGWGKHWIISTPGYDNGVLKGLARVDLHHVLSSGGGPRVRAFAATPALALVIAALRACQKEKGLENA